MGMQKDINLFLFLTKHLLQKNLDIFQVGNEIDFFRIYFENEMYFKLLNSELNHNGFQFQLGLNIDTKPFNDKKYEKRLSFL